MLTHQVKYFLKAPLKEPLLIKQRQGYEMENFKKKGFGYFYSIITQVWFRDMDYTFVYMMENKFYIWIEEMQKNKKQNKTKLMFTGN